MLLLFVPKITNRIRFVFRYIFRDILLIDISFTSDVEQFKAYIGPKISYCTHAIDTELFFLSKNLLFESGIKDQNISVFDWAGAKCFYSTSRNSALPFDPFAATFYLVSRYEEYLPTIHDSHGRYEARESLAYANGFLQKPIVNIWANFIKGVLKDKYPQLQFPESTYKYISTIDIDNAFAFKEKGVMRTVGAYIRSLINLDFGELNERMRVLLGLKKDPYDTYDHQLEIQRRYNLKTIYFFLFAEYGRNDKNVPVHNRNFRSLIKFIADYADVGIHPSYGSNTKPEKLETEIRRLSRVLNREITKSRQHFLKLTLPDTYRLLIDLDITDDYTMGYASEIGFRAGTCTPFNFYDLDLEVETKLKLHPFQVMDATLKYYMKIAPEEVMDYVTPVINETKAVNGTFVSLWHNESLSDARQWYGWKSVYEDIVKEASK